MSIAAPLPKQILRPLWDIVLSIATFAVLVIGAFPLGGRLAPEAQEVDATIDVLVALILSPVLPWIVQLDCRSLEL